MKIFFKLFTFIYIINIFVYKRSLSSTLTEFLIRTLKLSIKFNGNKEDALNRINQAHYSPYGKEKIPFIIKKITNVQSITLENCPCLVISKQNNYRNIIFYIHGGGYIKGIGIFQLIMLYRISKITDSMVLIPKYPLIPNTHEKSYEVLLDLYKYILHNYKNHCVVLMGDSAGGGLSLGLAEELKYNKLNQPCKLILLSPYVDISFPDKKMKHYEKLDPMLSLDEAKVLGDYWSGKVRGDHYRISPINGVLDHLKDVYIFVGDREIMYPDNIRLFEKLTDNNIAVKLFVGKGQNHVYPAIPNLEGTMAIWQIAEIIKN
ncbi:alpha/beta hydrolase fold domain-containing protein (plasmid) [Staphylococcus chromogenes]